MHSKHVKVRGVEFLLPPLWVQGFRLISQPLLSAVLFFRPLLFEDLFIHYLFVCVSTGLHSAWDMSAMLCVEIGGQLSILRLVLLTC